MIIKIELNLHGLKIPTNVNFDVIDNKIKINSLWVDDDLPILEEDCDNVVISQVKELIMKECFYKYSDAKANGLVEDLIPIHINKCRCENYFWNWSSDIGDWIIGEKIPKHLKLAYSNPPIVKSNYK